VGQGRLSQWWPAAFTADGVSYPSAEHYMMAAKARLSGDAEAVGKILAAPHPGAAKELGRQVHGFDEQHWAEHRFGVVVAGNVAKFSQPAAAGLPDWHRQPGPRRGFPAGPGLGHRAGRRR
jgi:ribA/ribD-fused uncharacterized protein